MHKALKTGGRVRRQRIRPADWGIGVTVCVGAIAGYGNAVIMAVDQMLTVGGNTADMPQFSKSIRESLGLSVVRMSEALEYPHPAHISGFESGKREPSLPLIVRYAELVGCSTDYLIDDRLELPAKRCKRIARRP